ncbi:MAG: AMP-binding protein [Alphaproteobacteria bacterium]|jgi:2-aminobenzoate-CoA ligase|nr:AMP-binding protein [Alphaproteobacteria bacterium]MDP6588149.1 AMP-binding protein [Alphaproteobacteria bacterium]MDP6816530.1 AMP-binding protein [Alphaproteobacteria bacterium]
MAAKSAHIDTFAAANLPPPEALPEFIFSRPELQYPARLNCVTELLDRAVAEGDGERTAILAPGLSWSYAELQHKVNCVAELLREDLGIVPGNRVLLRAANSPMLAACWLGVVKAGAIAVATMPLLRARELSSVIEKAEVGLALCDERLGEELAWAQTLSPRLERIIHFGGGGGHGGGGLGERMAAKTGDFTAIDTAAEDTCLIAFTSGTTGGAKGVMHFHRDILAACDCFPPACVKATPDDIFCGSPPLAFTFGLGGLLLFPLRARAATLLIEQPSPEGLLGAIAAHKASVLFTAPTGFRAMLEKLGQYDISSLRRCISAGETLPKATFEAWRAATGLAIIDGIGATEMLHIFISSADDEIRPGATGKAVPGYEARVIGEDGRELPPGEIGRLAVRGPTGCRYLMGEKQANYVEGGWNLTGDAYRMDRDGYFWFEARLDDMIISAGYNISGPEVEAALIAHDAVGECACVASPDEARGNIVKAFIVLSSGTASDGALIEELQNFVKSRIAPYKYPRAIEFVEALPKTDTGKVKRFRLREIERAAQS